MNYTYLFLALLVSCKPVTDKAPDDSPIFFPERAKDMNIYEVNIRQYTPEGTFQSFIPHLDRIQKMGVDILWIMPIQPIGKVNRKGTLGSYYSIQSYTVTNPEFGTLDDFKKLVNKAHDLEMLVILDWVGNHTAWDHDWIKINGYHTTDSAGNVVSPVEDWSDVADLNYDNRDMQNDMIYEMRFWVQNTDIDGFRCDVAGFVPMDFWDRAKDSLNVDKDLFMLAEWDEPETHSSFHMTYGWGFHHTMNEISKGNKNADSVKSFMQKDIERYGSEAFRMNFITNHDENSWNGTINERFGKGHKAYAVLVFTVQGMPLIYGGQEAGLNKRLAFFEKDTIDWSELEFEEFYTDLINLKKNNEALFNGAFGGQAEFINTENENVVAYSRTKGNNQVNVLINLSNDDQTVSIENKNFIRKDYFTEKEVDLTSRILAPFEYLLEAINE